MCIHSYLTNFITNLSMKHSDHKRMPALHGPSTALVFLSPLALVHHWNKPLQS